VKTIADKWNLTSSNAVELLEQQFYKENDYDPKNDYFHFHHLYKSGGTSLSGVIDRTVGLPKVGRHYEGVLQAPMNLETLTMRRPWQQLNN